MQESLVWYYGSHSPLLHQPVDVPLGVYHICLLVDHLPDLLHSPAALILHNLPLHRNELTVIELWRSTTPVSGLETFDPFLLESSDPL